MICNANIYFNQYVSFRGWGCAELVTQYVRYGVCIVSCSFPPRLPYSCIYTFDVSDETRQSGSSRDQTVWFQPALGTNINSLSVVLILNSVQVAVCWAHLRLRAFRFLMRMTYHPSLHNDPLLQSLNVFYAFWCYFICGNIPPTAEWPL